MTTAPLIGIDLGTTYSLAAVLRDGSPTIIPNGLGEHLTASAVSVRPGGEILVGAPARARAVTAPESTAVAFKRDMGTTRVMSLGPLQMTPVQLSALVLKSLKADAEAYLGREVEEAVVTVPAYFGDLQRQATRDAGTLAGLKVERIINEPTAAALAYGLQNRLQEQRVAVLDLGGGTFDVTVLEIVDGVIEVQATAGDARLGGEDFDDVLLELMQRRIGQVDWAAEPAATAMLREVCRRARHQLSGEPSSPVRLPELTLGSGKSLTIDEMLTRAEGEAAWAPLLSRLSVPVERALRDAGLRAAQLDNVLLVGGATRMPCVVELFARQLGRLPLRTLPPDEAIALGAAVQAGLKAGDRAVEDVVATDVAPFSLGVATSTRVGNQVIHGLFSPLIERGTTIPCSRVKAFSPMADGQTQVSVEVYQGEHAECARNQLLGQYQVTGLPALPAAQNTLEFRFTYDLNGILEVEISRLATSTQESFVLHRRQGLTPEQLATFREAMKRWKIHPRDLLPNTTALERADALFATRLGAQRAQLADAIARFRAALEGQDPKVIEQERSALVGLTRALE